MGSDVNTVNTVNVIDAETTDVDETNEEQTWASEDDLMTCRSSSGSERSALYWRSLTCYHASEGTCSV